jgi:3-hydroxyanthranilic acid dioxygenase
MEQGKPRDVEIKEGEIFCLPGRIPHSPQRFPDTMGLVLERERAKHETDGLRWHVHDGSHRILYQEWFYCSDLGTQLGPAIGRFKASENRTTDKPDRDYEAEEKDGKFPVEVDKTTVCSPAVNLKEWVAANVSPSPAKSAALCGPGAVDPCLSGFEYSCRFVTGPLEDGESKVIDGGEVFIYNMALAQKTAVEGGATGSGSAGSKVKITLTKVGGSGDESTNTTKEVVLPPEHVIIIPGGSKFAAKMHFEEGCVAMVVTNSALDKMSKEGEGERSS